MNLLKAIREKDLELVEELLESDPHLVNFHNEHYDKLLSSVKAKSIYCAECYQRIRQRPMRTTTVRGYVCDWPKHRRSPHKQDLSGDICCCDTPSGDLCNWMICADCFVVSAFELKATHQLISKKEGYSPLIVASCVGNLDIVELLLRYRAAVNDADPDGVTALHAAASMGHLDVLVALIDAGADVDSVDKEGRTALQRAVEAEAIDCAELLLEAGADAGICDKEGATMLHVAASVGHVGLIRTFLDCGLDPNALAKDGGTPLHWLPSGCRVPAANALLEAGAVLDVFDKDGMTPLVYATMWSNVPVVRLLIGAGASMEVRAPSWHNCLFASCLFHAPKVTEALLEAGAAMAPGQASPLVLCAQRNLTATAEVCLRHGVPGAAPALELAAYMGKIPVLKVLLQHWSGEGEMTQGALNMALIHAVRMDRVLAVKLLLEHGADAAANHFANSVMDFATSKRMRHLLQAHLSGQAEVEVDPEDEALVLSNKDYLQHALHSGTKPWGRSKIMIVGDGRAGKTALARSLIGEDFVHTESTIGISQMTCDVKHAEVNSAGEGAGGGGLTGGAAKAGGWEEYTKPDRELEAALASIVARRRGLAAAAAERDSESDLETVSVVDDDENSDSGDSAVPGAAAGASTGAGQARERAPKAKRRTAGDDRIGGSDEAEDHDESDGKAGGLVIDEELVMKYLASLNNSTKFVISLFDYGGQSVFNVIHHLFLTRYGVYALVFNMEQLVSSDVAVRENCLSTMSFWLNSVTMHTYDERTGETAPIFIVGTHKDMVSSTTDHQAISKLLLERFGQSVAWPSVVRYVEPAVAVTVPQSPTVAVPEAGEGAAVTDAEAAVGTEGVGDDGEVGVMAPAPLFTDLPETVEDSANTGLWFFPVDNRRGRRDTTVAGLMRAVERAIDASDYVHAEHPLTWLRTMDRLTSSGRVYLSLSEVTAIAGECGVDVSAVDALLSFLHEMGIVMWHSDAALRDAVILDPVAYFVTPATTIICKHLATSADGTRHVVDAHKACNKAHYDAWMRMVHRGIADRALLLELLADCGDQAEVVLQLMVKFGLLVPLEPAVPTGEAVSSEDPTRVEDGNAEVKSAAQQSDTGRRILKGRTLEYLIPALLPPSPLSSTVDDATPGTGPTFYLVFTCARDLGGITDEGEVVTTLSDCAAKGFLPRGLFERLLCKAVAWCRDATAASTHVDAAHRGVPVMKGENDESVPSTVATAENGEKNDVPRVEECIFQDTATLDAGATAFTLQLHADLNVIAVTVLSGEEGTVRSALEALAQQILRECMRSLQCIIAVPLSTAEGVAAGADAMSTKLKLLPSVGTQRAVPSLQEYAK